jgi:hypothetical protein
MTELPSLVPTLYAGWHNYQTLLTTALTPLSPDQWALRAAPALRSMGEIATHMIGAEGHKHEKQ